MPGTLSYNIINNNIEELLNSRYKSGSVTSR